MIIILLYDTGTRIQELVDIKIRDLHLEARNPFIIVTGTKSDVIILLFSAIITVLIRRISPAIKIRRKYFISTPLAHHFYYSLHELINQK